MNEFDFEELDKAVNSLMSKAPTQTKDETETSANVQPQAELPEQPSEVASSVDSGNENIIPTEIIAPTQDDQNTDDNAPMASTENVEEVETTQLPSDTVTTPGVTPTVKRSGRFMDVVHPSSDMRSATPIAPPTSRQGIAIQPPQQTTPTVPESVDPIPEQSVTDAPSENVAMAPFDSFSSPFLPDAQVEKRPLGGSNPDVSQESQNTNNNPGEQRDINLPLEPLTPKVDLAAALAEEAQDEPVLDGPEDIGAPITEDKPFIPEELHSDLVAIESNELQEQNQESTPMSAEEDSTMPQQESQAQETKIELEPEPVEPTIGSIPQQYQEQASSVEPTHTPLYAESSAQPLAVAPKKKSWVLIVLMILIAVLLAVAAAAGLFFAGLI